MSVLLLAALWSHLAACVLLVGAFSMLLLAGRPSTPTARRWEENLMRVAAGLAVLAIVSGIGWLLSRTALFENRPHAALELRAISHAVLDTWPGLVWLARHGLLLVLGGFLALRVDATDRRDWIAVRAEPLLLASLALGLVSGSSHAAAVSPGTRQAVGVDVAHLLATGVWLGSLLPMAWLLRAASRDDGVDARPYAMRAARRFSRVALLAMLALIASGFMNAVTQVESIAALIGTTHGRLLLAKLTVLVPILAVAVCNRTRFLPALSQTEGTSFESSTMRRLGAFVALEAGLAFALLALAAAMTLTTPARHAAPVWPLPFRFSFDVVLDVPATRWRVLVGSQLVVIGIVVLLVSLLLRGRRRKVLAAALVLVIIGTGIGLPPIVVDAYPTSYRRPLLSYHASSIAAGKWVYDEHCARCHGATAIDLRSSAVAESAKTVGWQVEPGRAWLVAPDFTVTVGPLAPSALRDYRGRRMVLLVLYTLPGSRTRMSELARMYDTLWVMGVEIIAVPTHAPHDAIAELGASPPIVFPVITDGAADIVATYRLFAPGPHSELLIDRQGYIRAIWDDGTGAIQSQVERLNAEKSPPPFPDDHVH
jgi:putative copper resistance protein D